MIDHYLFADEPVIAKEGLNERWKILIVDDEPEVHAVTRLALSDFKFLGRGLEFYSAESGEEGCKLMCKHPDAAIILLDVVMETDDAGLKVARYIREDLDNHFTRIILRTGQPGQAPERTVIINYDINDYKSKTELTAQKLFTAVMSSLRSYRDIMSIEHSRRKLEKALYSSADLFSEQSEDIFHDGIVQQFVGELVERLLHLEYHQLLQEGKERHPAGRVALILADALAVDGKQQEQLALAATLMAIIGRVAETSLATDNNAGRIYSQRLTRLTHSLTSRDNDIGVIPLLQAACASRFERYDGKGILGEVAAEQLPIAQQILTLLAIVYAELAASKQPAATLKQLLAEPEGRFSAQLMDALRNNLATVLETLENA